MKKLSCITVFLLILLTISCASKSNIVSIETETSEIPDNEIIIDDYSPRDTITLLFAGDIMAHNVNYNINSYEKIWKDVKHIISDADLSFANIEAPVDPSLPPSSFPNFNMPKKYLQASIDAGFDVFSLCNNHANDQSLNGILQTIKTTEEITLEYKNNNHNLYFSGLKTNPDNHFTYNIIEQNGWKILFLPITEILNRPDYSMYINFSKPTAAQKEIFINYVRELKNNNPCDLFILSVHANEAEYIRTIPEYQEDFYQSLLEAGVDIIWANHAHIIKNRKLIVNTQTNRDQLIMYANGNTISGQRTKPELTSKNPNGERDNTGDGLLYKVTLQKNNGSLKVVKAEPIFITTYINTAYEYVIKPLNQDFVDYLNGVPRANWAKYIERRIKINNDATKDLIEWQ